MSGPAASAGIQVCVLVALLGALAGIGLAVATDAVSRTTIGGPGWSLSGNGALVVLFAGGAALLAGGWASLARWRVRDRRWGTVGLWVGVVALVAAWIMSFGPVLVVGALGEAAVRGGEGAPAVLAVTFVLPPLLGLVGGLGTAMWVRGLTRRGVVAELVVLGLSAALVSVVPVARGLYFVVGPLVVLPLLAAVPVLFGRGNGRLFEWWWLAAACVALVVGVVGGVIGAQQVQGL